MKIRYEESSGKCLSSTRSGMDVDMFGLGLLRWVRKSVLSSKAPHRERVEFVLDGDEDGKGKGKKGNACLNLGVTKRKDSVDGWGGLPWLFLGFSLAFFLWNVVFQPEFGRGGNSLLTF